MKKYKCPSCGLKVYGVIYCPSCGRVIPTKKRDTIPFHFVTEIPPKIKSGRPRKKQD
jgi:uncharacterized Zn finger protein (UPF0148 family)